MGNTYYYFAASLPLLQFEGKPAFFSSEDFLNDCQRLLKNEDYHLIKAILSDNHSTSITVNAAYKSWKEFISFFNNELAYLRAQRAEKDPTNYIRGERSGNFFGIEAIRQAFKMTNLFEAEKILDRTKWNYLTELASGHYFDIEYLFIYGLKLKILERHQLLNTPKGKEIFEDLKQIDVLNMI